MGMKTTVSERTTEQLSSLAKEAGMNYDMLAKALSVSRRSISGWLSGQEPERINRVRINEFGRLVGELSTIIKPEKLKSWWNQPVANFAGSTPLQVLERGETDRIWRMIWEIREGKQRRLKRLPEVTLAPASATVGFVTFRSRENRTEGPNCLEPRHIRLSADNRNMQYNWTDFRRFVGTQAIDSALLEEPWDL